MPRIDDLKMMIKEHGESDECLLWPFATNGRYGKITIHNTQQAVHILAFELFISKEHKQVLHTCDRGLQRIADAHKVSRYFVWTVVNRRHKTEQY